MKTNLKGITDIRNLFRDNKRPIFFIGLTNFNLLSMDEWIGNFRHISYIDCYDLHHPHLFAPQREINSEFENIENYRSGQREVVDYNNYLLEHEEVIKYIKSFGGNPVALFLMFDEKTEYLCKKNGIEIWFPSATLRNKFDNKITTVRLGNLAGVPSVPNCLSKVNSYDNLWQIAQENHLGNNLVIQTAFGDSGHTTFFISNQRDWEKYANQILSNGEVKIMKRLNCYSATQEACITRRGTIIAPLQTELIGFPELTPDQGGWCGNELFPGAFTPEIQRKARKYTAKLGEELQKQGYRGYFNLDYLIDRESGELFLGELNPRISGATPLTSHAAFVSTDVPMFLFHLWEFSDRDFDIDIDVDDINAGWDNLDPSNRWSSLIIKHTSDSIETVTKAPRTGIWRMNNDSSISYSHFDYRCLGISCEKEAFVQRVTGVGNYRYKVGDLVRVILRDRVMTDDFQLSDVAKAWVKGILAEYESKPN